MKHARTASIAIIAIIAAVTLASCSTTPNTHSASSSASSFSNASQLRAYLADHSSGSSGAVFAGATMERAVGTQAAVPTAAPVANAAAGKTSDASVTYTGTNVQTPGVDEADIIKTNGSYIYTTVGQSVAIIKSLPANQTREIGNLTLNWTPQSLLLSNGTLYVIGNDYKADTYTIVAAYDVKDPARPSKLFEKQIEGNYITARYADKLYLVSQSVPQWGRPMPMPLIYSDGVRSSVPVDRIIMPPGPISDARYVTVASIEPNGTMLTTSIITDGYPTVYASDRAIYLAMTSTVNQYEIQQRITYDVVAPMLDSNESTLVSKINATDPEILSRAEKDAKIGQVLYRHLANLPQTERTKIQDEIDAKVKTRLKSYDAFEHTSIIEVPYATLEAEKSVTIKGTVNDQFSLDESNGVLRVVTTTNPRWALGEGMNATSNHVFTIENGKVLDEIDGIGRGERTTSARFIDNRLYLTTFQQTDPFYVFDLSDPRNVKQLGELKLPGFSRYLHPYSGDLVIGVGQNATETGRQTGLKISLFNVSDPARPTELASWVSQQRYASSSAEWEHKAFTLDKTHDLLVIPISGSYEPMPVDAGSGVAPRPQQTSGGALVFHITPDSLTLRGLVEHPGYSGAQRSLVINDALYTLSPSLLRVNAIGDLTSLAQVTLSEPSPYKVY